jgi:hypothetical protein
VANEPTPFTTKIIRLLEGDLFTFTVDARGLYVDAPNLYCVVALRPTGMSLATMTARMNAVSMLHNWAAASGIDLLARIRSLDLFRKDEITALRTEIRVNLLTRPKRPRRGGRRKARKKVVTNGQWRTRCAAVRDYVAWHVEDVIQRMSSRDDRLAEARERLKDFRNWNDEDVGDKRMTSLGPRSPETEAAKAEFERSRAAVDGSLAQLKERLDALARVGKALRVGRLETPASDVLRQFWRADMLGADLMVAGSAAIHLYEASAGVRVPQAIVPEGDLDLLMAGGRLDFDDIERVARRADKTFRWQRDRKSLNNNDGFRIDIIDRGALHSTLADLSDLSSEQHGALDAVLELPPVNAIAVGRDGMPVPMVGIDPRTFTLLKFVRAEFDWTRSGNASQIDREQAVAVGTLVEMHWRERFEPEWLEPFPELARSPGHDDPDGGGPAFFRGPRI